MVVHNMRQPFGLPSPLGATRQNNGEPSNIQEVHGVRKPDLSKELSCYRNDLADHFGIVPVAQPFRAMVALRVGVKNQCAVLKIAECANVGSIAFEHDVNRLLPERF